MRIINFFLIFIFSIACSSIKAQNFIQQQKQQPLNLKVGYNGEKNSLIINRTQIVQDSTIKNKLSKNVIKIDSVYKIIIKKSELKVKPSFEISENGFLIQSMPGQ